MWHPQYELGGMKYPKIKWSLAAGGGGDEGWGTDVEMTPILKRRIL